MAINGKLISLRVGFLLCSLVSAGPVLAFDFPGSDSRAANPPGAVHVLVAALSDFPDLAATFLPLGATGLLAVAGLGGAGCLWWIGCKLHRVWRCVPKSNDDMVFY